MGRQKISVQRDLFSSAEPERTIAPEVAKLLLLLLEQLLVDAIATEIRTVEGADEQDCA